MRTGSAAAMGLLAVLALWRPVAAEAPGQRPALRIAAYGDTCGNPAVHARIARAIAAHKPALVVHTGDFVPQGDKGARWREDFLDPARELLALCPFFTADGDDDRHALAAYCEQFRLPPGRPWHALRQGDLELFALSASAGIEPDGPQVRWLAEALAASQAPWRIVVTHYPLYSCGRHGSHDGLRRSILPLLLKHGVDLVLSGHDHHYERTHAIAVRDAPAEGALVQIVSGGGGQALGPATPQPWTAKAASCHHFCLLDVQADQAVLTACSEAGEPLDRFVLGRRDGRRECGARLGAEDVELVAYIRRFERLRFHFAPGQPRTEALAFTLRNAFDVELRGELTWEIAGECWAIDPPRQALRVPPGGEATLAFRATYRPAPSGADPEPVPQATLTSGALRTTAPGFYLWEEPPKGRRAR